MLLILKIFKSVSDTFGIRCPSSIIDQNNDVIRVFDFETCEWDSMPLNNSAFCGKCARKNSASLVWNINTTLTFSQVNRFELNSKRNQIFAILYFFYLVVFCLQTYGTNHTSLVSSYRLDSDSAKRRRLCANHSR
jgi:hypothetical protein